MDLEMECSKSLSLSDTEDEEPLINLKNNLKKTAIDSAISKNTNSKCLKKMKSRNRKLANNENGSLTEREKQEMEIERLKHLSELSENKLCKLQNDVNKICDKYKDLNADQIGFISNKMCNKWSSSTIIKSFKLLAACGPEGYMTIKSLYLPYPSLKTLQLVADTIED